MRALCGAIITAGALIGLGLTAMGIGQRYTTNQPSSTTTASTATTGAPAAGTTGTTSDTHHSTYVKLSQLDGPLSFALVFLTLSALIGMGITFLGLAYHHHRREREHLHAHAAHGGTVTKSTTII